MSTRPAHPPSWQWALLPGAVHDAGGRRSVRDWVVDGAAALGAAGLSIVVLDNTLDGRSEAAVIADIGLGVAVWAGLWARRSHPFAFATVAGIAGSVSAAAAGPALVALFNAALRCTRRELVIVTAIAIGASVVFPLAYPSDSRYLVELAFGLLLTGLVVGWGLFVRARRDALLSLRERATRLEAEQELQIELARAGERRRIAREMHDVLAHRISLLAVHAGALEYRHRGAPDEAAAAAVIRDNAHAALLELREVIGLLREGTGDLKQPEPPQPTLAEIPELIEQSRAAGMRLRASIAPPTGALDALVGRTAYRVVQEGLTNARKHAPAAAVEVTLAAGDSLVVEIVSRRPVATAPSPGGGGGAGLIGLAERVALAGGKLEHGPDAGGDFLLRATLPL